MKIQLQETDVQTFVRAVNALLRDGYTLLTCSTDRRWSEGPVSQWIILITGVLEKNPVPDIVSLRFDFGPVQERKSAGPITERV